MAALESFHRWDFSTTASTGPLKAVDFRGTAQRVTLYVETDAGCTATVQIQARVGSSVGPYAVMSSCNNSTSGLTVIQLNGPLGWVRPNCQAKSTGGLTVTMLGN